MVATTRSRSRAAGTTEATQTMLAPTPSAKKRTPKPKRIEKPKTDEDRSRPRTRGPRGKQPRSVSTKSSPRKPKVESVDIKKRSESRSVSRKRATSTKKDRSTKWKIDETELAEPKYKTRNQSKATSRMEQATKEAIKVKAAARKSPTEKRPRSPSSRREVHKNKTTKKPKLELKNEKTKNPSKEKPAKTTRANRSASQAPPRGKSSTVEAIETEDVPIARRTRSRSVSVAPTSSWNAPAKREPEIRKKKAQPNRAVVEVPIPEVEPPAVETPLNESETRSPRSPGSTDDAEVVNNVSVSETEDATQIRCEFCISGLAKERCSNFVKVEGPNDAESQPQVMRAATSAEDVNANSLARITESQRPTSNTPKEEHQVVSSNGRTWQLHLPESLLLDAGVPEFSDQGDLNSSSTGSQDTLDVNLEFTMNVRILDKKNGQSLKTYTLTDFNDQEQDQLVSIFRSRFNKQTTDCKLFTAPQ